MSIYEKIDKMSESQLRVAAAKKAWKTIRARAV